MLSSNFIYLASIEKTNKRWETEERSLTFFLLEGVRHDGICSGNREAVLSLEFKAESPVQEAKGASSAVPKVFSAVPVTEISQLLLPELRLRSTALQNTARLAVFTRVLFFWQAARWSRMQSLTGARASLWVAAKAGGMKLSSVQKGTESVSRGGGAALVKPRVCHCSAGRECFWKGGPRQRGWSESSRLSTLHVSETVHRASLALSELIGRLHSSVHWL